jgi:type I restriction enzyme S subunit
MDEFPHKICAVNEHVFILRTNNQLNQIYLYFWLDQSFMTDNIKNLNANSAQPGINQPGVTSLPILIPNKKTIDEYEQIVGPLLSKLFNNCKESASLSQIRDSLLSKLINGEIKL